MWHMYSTVEGESVTDVNDIVIRAMNDQDDGTYPMDFIDRWKRITTPGSLRLGKGHTHA